MTTGEALEPETTLRRLFTGALFAAAAIILFPDAWRAGGLAFLPLYIGGGLAGVTLGQIEDSSASPGRTPAPIWTVMACSGCSGGRRRDRRRHGRRARSRRVTRHGGWQARSPAPLSGFGPNDGDDSGTRWSRR